MEEPLSVLRVWDAGVRPRPRADGAVAGAQAPPAAHYADAR